MPTWDVSATATSKTGWPDNGIAPGPFVVSRKALDTASKATSCTSKTDQCNLAHPVNDTPTEATQFAWTDLGFAEMCEEASKVNDSHLQAYTDSSATFSVTLKFGCCIAQHKTVS